VDTTDVVEKLDETGIVLSYSLLGRAQIFRLEHRFEAVPEGTLYRSQVLIGSDSAFGRLSSTGSCGRAGSPRRWDARGCGTTSRRWATSSTSSPRSIRRPARGRNDSEPARHGPYRRRVRAWRRRGPAPLPPAARHRARGRRN